MHSPLSHPNFFIVGAPKCGTTSMAAWLAGHNRIHMSAVKEPHFFSWDLRNRNVTAWEDYRALFAGAKPGAIALGEASTWYLFSKVAIAEIEQCCPGAKYIVLTRDPVEMAVSLYSHNVLHLHEDSPNFETAWDLQEERAAGRRVPAGCREPAFLQYRSACSLGSLLRRLREQVPAYRIMHVSLKEMQDHPRECYAKVVMFLGLFPDPRAELPVRNQHRRYRSRAIQRLLKAGAQVRRSVGIQKGTGFARFNEVRTERATISESMRQRLEEAFAGERALLAEESARLAAGR